MIFKFHVCLSVCLSCWWVPNNLAEPMPNPQWTVHYVCSCFKVLHHHLDTVQCCAKQIAHCVKWCIWLDDSTVSTAASLLSSGSVCRLDLKLLLVCDAKSLTMSPGLAYQLTSLILPGRLVLSVAVGTPDAQLMKVRQNNVMPCYLQHHIQRSSPNLSIFCSILSIGHCCLCL